MDDKSKEYGEADFGTRRIKAGRNTPPPNLPVDQYGNGRRLQDYAELPCEKICEFQRKDPFDVVDKNSAKYQALVVSVAEKGVYNAIIVRRITDESLTKKGYNYEVLEGHHRLEASRELNKRTIPARIYDDCSDDEAMDIYQITNLLRKDQTIRSLAYGWYHYYRATRYKKAEEIQELITQGKVSESFNIMSETKNSRQLRRYACLHDLTDELLDLVDKKIISIKFGVEISKIDKSKQNDLLDYTANLKSLDKAKKLRMLAAGEIDGEKWGKEGIQKILFPDPLPSEKSTNGFSDREFIAMLQENIPKQYHEQEKMLELIQDALTLYFEKNPEKQT